MQKNITNILVKIFSAKFNWSLIVLAGLIYTVFFYTGYSSKDYDRTLNWFNYMILFSGASLLASYMVAGRKSEDKVGIYSVVSFLISMITLLLSKTIFNGAFTVLVPVIIYCLLPLSIFMFLLVVKHVFINTVNI
jgi:hypothetical protein